MAEFETEPHVPKEPLDPQTSYSIIVYRSSKLPEQYKAMVFAKWLRSLRFGNQLFKKCVASEYYKNYHVFIENLLKKPDSLIRLAVLTDDHDTVLGFAISREDVLDYLYVQPYARRIGVAKALLPSHITTFTHITTTAFTIWQGDDKKYKHLKFNPFA